MNTRTALTRLAVPGARLARPLVVRRWPARLVFLGLFHLGAAAAWAAEAPAVVSKEYQLKAAFLYNFTKFVEWPSARFPTATSPIVIGIFRQNPFGDELEKIVKGRMVNHRPIVVKRVQTAEDVLTVHLLFIPVGEENNLPDITWTKAAVLAVGESESFATPPSDGTIAFTHEGDKVRFAINLESAENSGLKISAQLLKLASDVHRKF